MCEKKDCSATTPPAEAPMAHTGVRGRSLGSESATGGSQVKLLVARTYVDENVSAFHHSKILILCSKAAQLDRWGALRKPVAMPIYGL